MAVTLISTTPCNDGQTVDTNTISGTIPVSTQVGDVAVFGLTQNGNNPTYTLPSGWGSLSGSTQSFLTHHAETFSKDMVSGDIGGSFTFTSSGTGRLVGVLAIYRGTTGAANIVCTSQVSGATTTTLTEPTVTTTVDNSWVVGVWTCRIGTAAPGPTLTYPSTESFDNRALTNYGASPNYAIEFSHLTTPGVAGAYGGTTATASVTTTNQIVFGLAIPPVVATSITEQFYRPNRQARLNAANW